MNILQTIVGHHLSNLFVDNVAFNVAKLLEESEEEQKYRMEKWAKEFNVQTKAEKKSIQQKLIELNNLI